MIIVELKKAGSSYCLAILCMFELYNDHVEGKAEGSKERKGKETLGFGSNLEAGLDSSPYQLWGSKLSVFFTIVGPKQRLEGSNEIIREVSLANCTQWAIVVIVNIIC